MPCKASKHLFEGELYSINNMCEAVVRISWLRSINFDILLQCDRKFGHSLTQALTWIVSAIHTFLYIIMSKISTSKDFRQ